LSTADVEGMRLTNNEDHKELAQDIELQAISLTKLGRVTKALMQFELVDEFEDIESRSLHQLVEVLIPVDVFSDNDQQ
jgi:DNA-binding TFAR19-related protein (PDSD5 family)